MSGDGRDHTGTHPHTQISAVARSFPTTVQRAPVAEASATATITYCECRHGRLSDSSSCSSAVALLLTTKKIELPKSRHLKCKRGNSEVQAASRSTAIHLGPANGSETSMTVNDVITSMVSSSCAKWTPSCKVEHPCTAKSDWTPHIDRGSGRSGAQLSVHDLSRHGSRGQLNDVWGCLLAFAPALFVVLDNVSHGFVLQSRVQRVVSAWKFLTAAFRTASVNYGLRFFQRCGHHGSNADLSCQHLALCVSRTQHPGNLSNSIIGRRHFLDDATKFHVLPTKRCSDNIGGHDCSSRSCDANCHDRDMTKNIFANPPWGRGGPWTCCVIFGACRQLATYNQDA